MDVFEQAARFSPTDDWEIAHNRGLCLMYLKQYDAAAEAFQLALDIHPHDVTHLELGKVYTLKDDLSRAIRVYQEALDAAPENPEILTTLGLLFLRQGDSSRAFQFLGNSLTYDPRNPKVR